MGGIVDYIKSFPKVILWGAGNLGKELGQELLRRDVSIFCYWDKNYKEIKKCNNIIVNESFTEDPNDPQVLVISSIVNGIFGDNWTKDVLIEKGYKHYLLGMPLYEG